MIEELVHTKEGELRSKDPYLVEGSTGYYIPDSHFVFEVTKACVAQTFKARARGDINVVYVNFIEGPGVRREEVPLPYGKNQLKIMKEGK